MEYEAKEDGNARIKNHNLVKKLSKVSTGQGREKLNLAVVVLALLL